MVPSLLILCLDLLISLVTSGCSLGDLPHVGLNQTGNIRVPADLHILYLASETTPHGGGLGLQAV